jgi:hypothetical protein
MEIEKKSNRKDAIIASAIALGCIALIAVAFIAPSKKKLNGTSGDYIVPVKGKYESLQFFAYSSGLTGIYDRDDKTLYVYDSSLKKCFLKRRIDKLGEDLIELNNLSPQVEK